VASERARPLALVTITASPPLDQTTVEDERLHDPRDGGIGEREGLVVQRAADSVRPAALRRDLTQVILRRAVACWRLATSVWRSRRRTVRRFEAREK
jgi:hypothetical protein